MPIEFSPDLLENDDFRVETDTNGNLVQTHKQTGAKFKFDSTKNRWIPVEGIDLEGADIDNVGSLSANQSHVTNRTNEITIPNLDSVTGSGTMQDPWVSPSGTAGFQEAVNTYNPGEVVFRYPAGVYEWTTNFTDQVSRVTIKGDGRPSILSDWSGPTWNLAWNPGSQTTGGFFDVGPADGWEIDGIRCINNGHNAAAMTFSNGTSETTLRNLSFGGPTPTYGFRNALLLNQFYHSDIERIYGNSNGRLIFSEGDMNQTTINHVRAMPDDKAHSFGNAIGIELRTRNSYSSSNPGAGRPRGISIQGVHVLGHNGATDGVVLIDAIGVNLTGLQVEEFSSHAVWLKDGTNGAGCESVTVSTGYIHESATGVLIENSTSCTIEDLFIQQDTNSSFVTQSETTGLALNSGTSDCNWRNMSFYNLGTNISDSGTNNTEIGA